MTRIVFIVQSTVTIESVVLLLLQQLVCLHFASSPLRSLELKDLVHRLLEAVNVVVDQPLLLKSLCPQQTDQCKVLVDFPKVEHSAVAHLDDRKGFVVSS